MSCQPDEGLVPTRKSPRGPADLRAPRPACSPAVEVRAPATRCQAGPSRSLDFALSEGPGSRGCCQRGQPGPVCKCLQPGLLFVWDQEAQQRLLLATYTLPGIPRSKTEAFTEHPPVLGVEEDETGRRGTALGRRRVGKMWQVQGG